MSSLAISPKKSHIYMLLLPGVIIYLISCLLPLLFAVYYSFFNWDGGPFKEFIGLGNYKKLLMDGAFWSAFVNNIKFIIWTVLGQIGIALILSVLMISKSLKYKKFHRTVLFFPVVLSAVVVAFLWRIIYNKDYGLLNLGLNALGLGKLIKPWLDDPRYVITSLAIPKIWQYIGYYLVILLAAINSIDTSILESAELDGAIGWKRTWYIIMPLIKNTLIVTIILCISGNMKTFDQIFVMTGGGPGTSSMVVAIYAYQVSMERMDYGYGSCVAIGILILSLMMIMLSKLAGRRKDEIA